MGFEKFTLVGKSFAPRVSIWSRGQIGFNNGAVSRYKLDEFSHIVFFFDRELNKVGLRFTNDGSEEGAVKLNKRSTGIRAAYWINLGRTAIVGAMTAKINDSVSSSLD